MRSTQTQRSRPAAAGWIPRRLPALPERRPSRAALSLLPQTALRSARQQPLPPPPRRQSPATQQIGNCLSPRRQSHPTHRRSACRLTFAATIVGFLLSRIRPSRIYKYATNFRRQLKARLLKEKIVTQIVRETTLTPDEF